VVFYSRKITPEDVTAVLEAGAVDAIRKGALKPEELLARLAVAQERELASSPSALKPTAKTETEIAGQHETSDTSGTAPALLARAKNVDSWLGASAKLFGLGTAILTFLLTGSKSLAWFHRAQSTLPGGVNRTAGLEVVAILLGWYVVVYLLFVTGSVFHRIFAEIWKAIVYLLRLVPWFRKKLVGETLHAIQDSVPKVFDLAWDACVVVVAVVPALRYTAALLGAAVSY